MWAARAMPECRGVEVKASAEREIVEKIKSHARTHTYSLYSHSSVHYLLMIRCVLPPEPPRHEDFSYVGMGLSMYSPKWMEEGKHMQSVRGMAFVVVRVTDEEDLMREMEERKRIKRELQKEQGERGEDDQDIYGLDDDADDATPLVERDMVPVKKPMMPPVIPTPISIGTIVFQPNLWATETDDDVNAAFCRCCCEQGSRERQVLEQGHVQLLGEAARRLWRSVRRLVPSACDADGETSHERAAQCHVARA